MTCWSQARRARHAAGVTPQERVIAGDYTINGDGYRMLYLPFHPNVRPDFPYIAEHRVVGERKIGRLLTAGEVVHHRNGDKLDNRPANLDVMDRSEHSRMHGKERGVRTRVAFAAYYQVAVDDIDEAA